MWIDFDVKAVHLVRGDSHTTGQIAFEEFHDSFPATKIIEISVLDNLINCLANICRRFSFLSSHHVHSPFECARSLVSTHEAYRNSPYTQTSPAQWHAYESPLREKSPAPHQWPLRLITRLVPCPQQQWSISVLCCGITSTHPFINKLNNHCEQAIATRRRRNTVKYRIIS